MSIGTLLRLGALVFAWATAPLAAQSPTDWPIHDLERPRPVVVHPGGGAFIPPPADAIVLFNGRGLEAWVGADGAAPRWRLVGDDAMEVVAGTGTLRTRQEFGDVQLHVEWRTPAPPSGTGQARGNSGVFLMGRYEVQVLDSWENATYADGQAGSIYGQYPPMVNAALPPGEWQSFDIIFRRPRFASDGSVTRPARMTVLHNGIVVHAHVTLIGPTSHRVRAPYEVHPDRLPITLQDHGDAVQFRNIWVRALPEQP